MLTEFFNLFNLIGAIFCYVTSLFLFTKGTGSKKIIPYFFALYFLSVGSSLTIIFLYAALPNISINMLQILILFSIFVGFVGMLSLLLSSFYFGYKFSKKTQYIQILFTICSLIVVLLLYPSSVILSQNALPQLSLFFALIILGCFSIPYFFCIINLHFGFKNEEKGILENYFTIFYFLAILISFAKILSFFEININNTLLNLTFMNIFVFLFFVQGLIVVYFFPISNNKSINSKTVNPL